jgi:hypothetical protein
MPEKMKRVSRLACPLLQTRRKNSAQHDLDLKLPKLPDGTKHITERKSHHARHLDLTEIVHLDSRLPPDPQPRAGRVDGCLPGKRGLMAEMPRRVAAHGGRHMPPTER